jgi:hypothetical protein
LDIPLIGKATVPGWDLHFSAPLPNGVRSLVATPLQKPTVEVEQQKPSISVLVVPLHALLVVVHDARPDVDRAYQVDAERPRRVEMRA